VPDAAPAALISVAAAGLWFGLVVSPKPASSRPSVDDAIRGLAVLAGLCLAMPAFALAIVRGATPGGLANLGAVGAGITVTLSILLTATLFALCGRVGRGLGARLAPGLAPTAGVLVAGGLALGLIALSSQVYYALYRQLIPGLPWQWVISAPAFDTLAIWRPGPLGERLRGATVVTALVLAVPRRPVTRPVAAVIGAAVAAGLHVLNAWLP